MSAPRFFTDEDIYASVAQALRRGGIDAISTPETGRLGQSDDSQLEWAADEQRVFVSFNVAHFAALHADWLSKGRHHAGIVLSSQRAIGDTVRRLRDWPAPWTPSRSATASNTWAIGELSPAGQS